MKFSSGSWKKIRQVKLLLTNPHRSFVNPFINSTFTRLVTTKQSMNRLGIEWSADINQRASKKKLRL